MAQAQLFGMIISANKYLLKLSLWRLMIEQQTKKDINYWVRPRWRRNAWSSPSSRGRVEMRELRQILEGYAPIVTTGDKPVWRQDMGGKFMIKATYCHFINRGMLVSNTNWVWKTNCPPKVRMFLWLLSKRALLTWPQLQRRGQIVPNMCLM